jgi:hypothetical protein
MAPGDVVHVEEANNKGSQNAQNLDHVTKRHNSPPSVCNKGPRYHMVGDAIDILSFINQNDP